MTELEKAYNTVFFDMLHNGPNIFQGIYDAKHGSKKMMCGIGTVMEYLAMKADSTETIYEQFSDFFTYNLKESVDIAKRKWYN